jgi:phosphoglycerate dehydrogenase-like enzyme
MNPPHARVLTTCQLVPEALALLAPLAEVVTGPVGASDEWYAAADYDALILDGATWMPRERMARFGPRLRIIARLGIGVDRIDIPGATALGIMVLNTPDAPTESTAEHAIGLILALTKRIAVSDRMLRAGAGFDAAQGVAPGLELAGATLGLVGLGRIGGRVAVIAGALGMRVRAYDPLAAPDRAAALGVELAPSLADLLAVADVVSLHCPALPETYHLIDAAALARMRPGSYLVNVARGPIVDEAALLAALRSGHLAGAGVDVYDPEPPAANNPLFSLPNTICTAHIASHTAAGFRRMHIAACEQVAQALRGARPAHLLNPEVLRGGERWRGDTAAG